MAYDWLQQLTVCIELTLFVIKTICDENENCSYVMVMHYYFV